jgi:hypothetical protein
MPPLDLFIVSVWLSAKVFEGLPCDLLVKFKTDGKFKLSVFEDLMQKHGIATTDPQDALQTLREAASRQMDAHFMAMRQVQGAPLEGAINVEALFLGLWVMAAVQTADVIQSCQQAKSAQFRSSRSGTGDESICLLRFLHLTQGASQFPPVLHRNHPLQPPKPATARRCRRNSIDCL